MERDEERNEEKECNVTGRETRGDESRGAGYEKQSDTENGAERESRGGTHREKLRRTTQDIFALKTSYNVQILSWNFSSFPSPACLKPVASFVFGPLDFSNPVNGHKLDCSAFLIISTNQSASVIELEKIYLI